MSDVFQNIDPPTPSPPGECVPPAFGAGGGHTRWVERGVGVNILEDAGHSSVLYICKYFVVLLVKEQSYMGCGKDCGSKSLQCGIGSSFSL
jgi:hypothetical protein